MGKAAEKELQQRTLRIVQQYYRILQFGRDHFTRIMRHTLENASIRTRGIVDAVHVEIINQRRVSRSDEP